MATKLVFTKTLTSAEVLLSLAKYEASFLSDDLVGQNSIFHVEYAEDNSVVMYITQPASDPEDIS